MLVQPTGVHLMTADEARRLVLVRCFEDEAVEASSTWTRADQHWADSEALRRVGEQASPSQWLLERADLAVGRLLEREPSLAALAKAPRWRSGAVATALLLAAFVGAALSALLTPPDRIDLLAPPLLAVMAWNLVVYAAWLVQAIGRMGGRRSAASPGVLGTLVESVLEKIDARRRTAQAPAAVQRFVLTWARASLPLRHARVAALLHLGAVAVAAGALLALYLRGLVFEFSAGWDSTFLSAEAVHRWLSVVLAPALALTGHMLPDAARLEQLRFSRGGAEPAALWIHLHALTLLIVMLPRALLALAALMRSRRLQRRFPLALDDGYFMRRLQWLARARGGPGRRVVLLPYGCRIDPAQREALTRVLDHEDGPGVTIEVRPTIAAGADSAVDAISAPDGRGASLIALFALSATPERETHGDFLRHFLARGRADPAARRVMVDESGYRARLALADRERRLDERRRAWRTLCAETGAGEPWFVDLSTDAAHAAGLA